MVKLTPENIEKDLEVTYMPKKELGIVSSWNDTYVHVKYYPHMNSQATYWRDLVVGDYTFECGNELNSVLDGAFGRCVHKCDYNCFKR